MDRLPLHDALDERHVVGVLLITRVVREDQRATEPHGQTAGGLSQEERVMGVEDVEITRSDSF
jgi:hypothetical protein